MCLAAQSEIRFRFEVPGGPVFDVVRFELREGLSEPFRLELELSSADSDIDLDSLLDVDATFTIERDDLAVRALHGSVSLFEQCVAGFRRTRYRVVVEPSLARLRLWHGSRIHQQLSVPDILKIRLKDRGQQGRFVASRSHEVREYCIQHRETDFAFFARLAAEEGFVFFFDAFAQSQLVLTDSLLAAPRLPDPDDIGTVVYQPQAGGDAPEPRLWQFALRRELAPTQVTQRDNTFRNPDYSLEHASIARDAIGRYEHYDFPGRYKRDQSGKPFTATKLQQLRTGATIATLAGDDARLWPGLAFLLEGHPGDALNRDWRVIAMRHSGRQDVSQEEDGAQANQGTYYEYTAEAVPGHIEWRPPALPRPVMDGVQIAHVVGEKGEEIYPDEHGRVKVWFPWDRQAPMENSSCWIRVSENWAGAGFGTLFLPRVGQEVIVDFVNGDPDQPIVTGRTFHAANRPPLALPGLKTVSTIRSREHKGSGHNELLIDDTSGELKAQLHSSHGATQLNIGNLTHARTPDGRGEPRGEGFELRSDQAGALRASSLLFSAYARELARGRQLDVSELLDLLHKFNEDVAALLDTAAQHQAPAADHSARSTALDAIRQLGAGANDRPGEAGAKAIIALGAPDGIVAGTPQTMLLAAGENIEVSAQHDMSATASQRIRITAGHGISQFAYDGGIAQIAHRDDIDFQAQHGHLRAQAAENMQLGAKHVVVHGAERLTFTCGGAYLTMSGGNIELGCPGKFTVKADVDRTGPASLEEALASFGHVDTAGRFGLVTPDGTQPIPDRRFRITLDDGAVMEGRTDAQGLTPLLQRDALRIAQLEVFDDEAE